MLLNRKLLVPVHVDSYVNCNPCNDAVRCPFCCSVYVFNVSCGTYLSRSPLKKRSMISMGYTWINKGLK